ncbi:hypothetical protein [Roseibium sp. LAB1]
MGKLSGLKKGKSLIGWIWVHLGPVVFTAQAAGLANTPVSFTA